MVDDTPGTKRIFLGNFFFGISVGPVYGIIMMFWEFFWINFWASLFVISLLKNLDESHTVW
jgi:hypothetical protein